MVDAIRICLPDLNDGFGYAPAVTIDDAAADQDAFACRFAGGQAVAIGPVHAD